MKTPRQVVIEWAAAFNERNAAAAAALYHEDAINIQVPCGEPLQGRQAILENFTSFFRAFPDSYTRVESIFQDGDWAILEWSGGGRLLGEFAGHSPTGRSFTVRGCGFFQIVDHKIRSQRGYWDRATWFNQLGLPVD
jgi:steroid delta-isomerase-like uncharacterized protein